MLATATVDIYDMAEQGRRHLALRVARCEWLEPCAERLGVAAGEEAGDATNT